MNNLPRFDDESPLDETRRTDRFLTGQRRALAVDCAALQVR